ncbi:MAG: cupin domain-containing protein [Ruminococcaceae bacterium]|nr:cupin domain-containing protein [Oscillospiraceae bacterium]
MGKIQWGAVAYIEKNGGGPEGNHTHSDNHIFIVVDGEVEVFLNEESHIVKKDDMFFVDGMIPHSIWNHGESTAKVIKISVAREEA